MFHVLFLDVTTWNLDQGPVNTTPEKFENADFTLKTHQMFSIQTTSEEIKRATINGQFEFVFEESQIIT